VASWAVSAAGKKRRTDVSSSLARAEHASSSGHARKDRGGKRATGLSRSSLTETLLLEAGLCSEPDRGAIGK